MKKTVFITFVLLFGVVSLYSQNTMKYITLDINSMNKLKKQYETSKIGEFKEINSINVEADNILKNKYNYSIVYKKTVPPSGDKHDYVSMGPYWWPDPTKPDGLPYINKDGQVNPKSRTDYTDKSTLDKMANDVFILAKAYFYLADEKYVIKAKDILSEFFLNEKSKMNPNLKYAQFIPGLNYGRGIGIIETTSLINVMEAVGLLSDSPNWTNDVDKGIKEWMSDYLNWLLTHPNGIAERKAANNHGTHYDRQCVTMYIFLNEIDKAKDYIIKYTIPRLESQVLADGSQPHELKRTKSWNYTTMNLLGFVELAKLAQISGVNLSNYNKNGQIYIKSMIDWFVPYLKKEKEWTWKQIKREKVTRIVPALKFATEQYNDISYLNLIDKLQTIHSNIIKD